MKAIPEEVEMEEIKVPDTTVRETKMWTDKYKPLQPSDLVGNAGSIA